MTIKRLHIIVLLAACLMAAGSTFFLLAAKKNGAAALSYCCFKTKKGWGYNILAGKKIIIHQPFMPGVAGQAGFGREQQAAAVAQIVIEKIKSGHSPSVSCQQLQRLGILHTQAR